MLSANRSSLSETDQKSWINILHHIIINGASVSTDLYWWAHELMVLTSISKDGVELAKLLEFSTPLPAVPSLQNCIDEFMLDKSLCPHPPTFVFDETNIALLAENNKKPSKSAVERLAKYTKRENKISVMLASFECTCFSFQIIATGCQCQKFNSVVFVTVPPNQMSGLLKKWKVGENLSASL